MPLKKGYSHKVVADNIKEMIAAGHKPKQAIAASLAKARKMAMGGYVDEGDGEPMAPHMAEGGLVDKLKSYVMGDAKQEQENIGKKITHGMDKEKAKSFASAFTKDYADGGMVEDDDLDEEHERGLFNLMEQGDQPPIANPHTQSLQKKLATALHMQDEMMEPYAMGGLVEGDKDGPMGNKPSESMKSAPKEDMMGHLTDAARKALEEKKKKRKFGR